MANEYVATTRIRHGEDDGSVTVWEPGEDVSNHDVDADLMQEWWDSGALAVKGSAEDPNLRAVMQSRSRTTPAMVQDALQAQLRASQGPNGTPAEATKTQPDEDHPENPAELLGVGNPSVDPAEAASHTTSDAGGNLGNTGTRTGNAHLVKPSEKKPAEAKKKDE